MPESYVPPDYPFQLFPGNNLPHQLVVAARLAVKCSYAEEGAFGAAIIRHDHESGPQLVMLPIEEIDGWVDKYLEQRRNDGAVDIDAQRLSERDVQVAHEIQMDQMARILHEIDPHNRVA
jgi:hypothetical protein